MVIDLGDGFSIRQARDSDRAALSYICLKTGNAGQDASEREDDPELIALVYALPYLDFAPEFAFVVEGPSGVCGYVLGALDTASFNARLARDWYPGLHARVADPNPDRSQWTGSDWLRHHIHHPPLDVATTLAAYPSHAHIDLLPDIQGRGFGRRLLTLLEERLAGAGSPGLHLGLDPRNENALRFYEALGYARLRGGDLSPDACCVGKALRFKETPGTA
jgi:ribosomal protein S18 acetylase RimI-like enzyme